MISIKKCVEKLCKPDFQQLKALLELRASIKEFGFLRPIIVDAGHVIVAGHGTWLAARELGLAHVPVTLVEHLTAEQLRMYAIADNQLGTLSSWDDEQLRVELTELAKISLDMSIDPLNLELTGFTTAIKSVGGLSELTAIQQIVDVASDRVFSDVQSCIRCVDVLAGD